ncbi:MAG: 3-oxoacyl-ACP reductase FabG [Clostridia bacterium]|nr:3-oxoacyl-ACP reductase FabG [Clostridia bacterium]
MSFLSKTVLITGGAKGIGKAVAKAFKREGYNVCITYNSSMAAAYEMSQAGYTIYKVDITNETEVLSCIDDIITRFGKIDCLVNNAGIAETRMFTSITEERLRHMLDTNLIGAFNVTRDVINKSMLARKSGCVINISSIWGRVGGSCEVHYSASKAGLIGLTKALAKEMGPSNIRINAVAPGVIKTDMIKNLAPDEIDQLKEEIPLRRIGTPEEVADVVYFLASDSSQYITGEVITVDGGMYT